MATPQIEAMLTEAMDRYWSAEGGTVGGVKAVLELALSVGKPAAPAHRYREFDFRHDDFHLDGLFPFVELLLIEASYGLRGFQIESVRLLVAEDHAVAVPTCISDYVAAWALTDAGKAKLQSAYEASLPDDGQSYAYPAPSDYASIWSAA